MGIGILQEVDAGIVTKKTRADPFTFFCVPVFNPSTP
jgi:hypothetical protein